MNGYIGIGEIDPIERSKQHELTKALWQKLHEMGIKTGESGRIKGILTTNSYEQARALMRTFQDGHFEATIYNQEETTTHLIEITTPISRLSVEALLELTDMLLASVLETDIKFDGLELDVNEVKKLNAPWWKFW